MSGKANILQRLRFGRSKAAAKRISSLVLAVLMLQVVAAGFCMPVSNAAPVSQVSAMEHCMDKTMSMADMDKSKAKHACAHCDMPDATVAWDKHTFSSDNIAVTFMVVAMAATIHDMAAPVWVELPPDLFLTPTSLTTFNLNLRIRV